MMVYSSLFCELTVIIYTFSLSDNNSLIFIFFLLLLCFLFEEVFSFSFFFTRSHTAHKFWRQSWASLVRLYADQISFIFKSVSAGGVERRTFLFYHSFFSPPTLVTFGCDPKKKIHRRFLLNTVQTIITTSIVSRPRYVHRVIIIPYIIIIIITIIPLLLLSLWHSWTGYYVLRFAIVWIVVIATARKKNYLI